MQGTQAGSEVAVKVGGSTGATGTPDAPGTERIYGPEPALEAARAAAAKGTTPKGDHGNSPVKRCDTCGNLFPRDTDHFHRNRTRPDGLTARCKSCNSEAAREWIMNHRQQVNRRQQRAYWEKRKAGFRRARVFKGGVFVTTWAPVTPVTPVAA